VTKLQQLKNELTSKDSRTRINAIVRAGKLHVKSLLPDILKLSQSPDVTVRLSVIEAAGSMGKEAAPVAGPVLVVLAQDPEPIVRAEAIEVLGELAYAPALDLIMTLLAQDEDAMIRACAAEALGDMQIATSLPVLIGALSDPDEAVRSFVANSIGLLQVNDALAPLTERLQHETSTHVKAELHAAKYRLGSRHDLIELLTIMNTEDDKEAADSLLNIIEDLTDRCAPLRFEEDSTLLRSALESLGSRIPFVAPHVAILLQRL